MPDGLRDKVRGSLEREILVTRKGHIDSGVLGTYFLLKSLIQDNRSDLVYPMVHCRTYPGWGYMLDQGATTLWERWNGDESQNHTSFLSVGAWFIEGLAGIRADPASPGFEYFFVRPAVTGDLTFARASYDPFVAPLPRMADRERAARADAGRAGWFCRYGLHPHS